MLFFVIIVYTLSPRCGSDTLTLTLTLYDQQAEFEQTRTPK